MASCAVPKLGPWSKSLVYRWEFPSNRYVCRITFDGLRSAFPIFNNLVPRLWMFVG